MLDRVQYVLNQRQLIMLRSNSNVVEHNISVRVSEFRFERGASYLGLDPISVCLGGSVGLRWWRRLQEY